MSHRMLGRVHCLASTAVLLIACSGSGTAEPSASNEDESGGAFSDASGGARESGGGATTLGGSNGTGLTTATAETGGSASETGGRSSTGSGAVTGGSKTTGGSNSSGGIGSTTKATGGVLATGGSKPGGGTGNGVGTGGISATGGASSTGHSSTSSSFGGSQPTGGASSVGGANTGGASSTGGARSGGAPSTGGAKTGGALSTGGATSNNTSVGTWTTGYVATMYGNVNSGDCVQYRTGTGTNQIFGDQTPIDTYTCVGGSGTRKVTLSSFQSGVANNASYYAALGDLSSLWKANGDAAACTCNGSDSCGSQSPSCPDEIKSVGACGLCIAVKCDPSSTFKDSQNYSHNSSCNSTTYVVVQNIDACPHNHPTNLASADGWCTAKQSQHIDLSCSALGDISSLGIDVGKAGWLPVVVQVVDCGVGLGKHSL